MLLFTDAQFSIVTGGLSTYAPLLTMFAHAEFRIVRRSSPPVGEYSARSSLCWPPSGQTNPSRVAPGYTSIPALDSWFSPRNTMFSRRPSTEPPKFPDSSVTTTSPGDPSPTRASPDPMSSPPFHSYSPGETTTSPLGSAVKSAALAPSENAAAPPTPSAATPTDFSSVRRPIDPTPSRSAGASSPVERPSPSADVGPPFARVGPSLPRVGSSFAFRVSVGLSFSLPSSLWLFAMSR